METKNKKNMPIKNVFIIKTVVRGSEDIAIPDSINKELKALRIAAENDSTPQDGEFEILVTRNDGKVSSDLYTEGKLTDAQTKTAKTILEQAVAAVKAAADDEKIKVKFIIQK
jgi:hypothetical protein